MYAALRSSTAEYISNQGSCCILPTIVMLVVPGEAMTFLIPCSLSKATTIRAFLLSEYKFDILKIFYNLMIYHYYKQVFDQKDILPHRLLKNKQLQQLLQEDNICL